MRPPHISPLRFAAVQSGETGQPYSINAPLHHFPGTRIPPRGQYTPIPPPPGPGSREGVNPQLLPEAPQLIPLGQMVDESARTPLNIALLSIVALVRFAPLRFASTKITLVRFALIRFALVRFAFLRIDLLRFAPAKFA